jgi:hypothetical protein
MKETLDSLERLDCYLFFFYSIVSIFLITIENSSIGSKNGENKYKNVES